MESMKLKVKIIGPKVHDVGYRYLLMSNAIDLGLKGFHARNKMGEKEQEVIVLVDGDEEAIADFKVMVGAQKPEHAEVSNITCVDYEGDVMRTGEYAQVCSAQQLNKAIPLLLNIRDDLKEMKCDVKEMKGDIKAVRKTGDETLNEIKAVRKNTDTTPQISEDMKAVRKTTDATLDEIKGMREDIQPGYAKQMQTDIRAIKERLGMQ
jgi:acylphosphatase/gas vesicle protein